MKLEMYAFHEFDVELEKLHADFMSDPDFSFIGKLRLISSAAEELVSAIYWPDASLDFSKFYFSDSHRGFEIPLNDKAFNEIAHQIRYHRYPYNGVRIIHRPTNFNSLLFVADYG